uniref:Uncharacterized protein n=1 Tax=Periophthalmus magnuspinnatus TaxID=409849 RepID=A0A3B3ZX09_9GOBI
MTKDASLRARDAFITLARASLEASASAAMALCSTGSFTSFISTRSTLIPQSSVASSKL